MRQSVDITRLSVIVRGNLEKDHNDNSDFYPGAQANSGGDIKLDNADAELDFQQRREEGVLCYCTEDLSVFHPKYYLISV